MQEVSYVTLDESEPYQTNSMPSVIHGLETYTPDARVAYQYCEVERSSKYPVKR